MLKFPSMFHIRYLLESILKSQVQIERMFYKTKAELLFLCLLHAGSNSLVRELGRGKTHQMASAPRQDSDQIINMFSLRYPSEEAVQESTAKTSNCVDTQAYQSA